VVTRLPVGLMAKGTWGDTAIELPSGAWTDVISGRKVTSGAITEVLAAYPVALLVPVATAEEPR
ncbi:hypothetical protein, partial [Nocardioides sp.]|uniref:hypothetical protein n=1 Tax=Nocardioides sp. TaxID=35761 RepID=UPI0031FEA44E|nr:maltooligosyl trehalose synthase [Nocardioides sp.]